MKLRINRKRWLRGEKDSGHGDNSYLLRTQDKKMCCLGFLARAVGYTAKEIADQLVPAYLEPKNSKRYTRSILPLVVRGKSSAFCNKITALNDQGPAESKKREDRIKSIFKKHLDVEVIFEG